MNRGFITHNHGAHINTSMHRAKLMDLEDCAPEGGELPDAYGPISCEPIKSVEQEHPWLWYAYAIVLLAVIAASHLVAVFGGI